MIAGKLYDYLNELIPPSLSCDWDNDGLMCAAGINNEVKRVLLTLDVTDKAVKYAVKNNFDTIISHHPLIFKPIKNLQNEKLMMLIKNDITVMSFHTRLDAVEDGVNSQFANLLELSDIEPFGEVGRIGSLPHEFAFLEFIDHIKDLLNCDHVSAIKQKNTVRRVAVTGGDGKDFYNDVLETDADTYLTGSMSYNTMVDAAESHVNVIEAGHYQTENFICKYLEQLVLNLDKNIKTEIFSSNPILYY